VRRCDCAGATLLLLIFLCFFLFSPFLPHPLSLDLQLRLHTAYVPNVTTNYPSQTILIEYLGEVLDHEECMVRMAGPDYPNGKIDAYLRQ
jgi:hypothetical protein